MTHQLCPQPPLFPVKKTLIGMVHVRALPGTPKSRHSVKELGAACVSEARALQKAGFDALLLENMHDAPYIPGPHGPEIAAAMTAVAVSVREAVGAMPIGIQILARGEREALAVALAADCEFIRCENFVYSHVADEGLMVEASAGPLLRYRRNIGAEHVRIICDLKKKHASHAITSDISLADVIHGAEFFGADGVIITGAATGQPASISDVAAARKATALPVWIGSGVSPEQMEQLAPYADAIIVGSYLKREGHWTQPLDLARCDEIAAAFKKAISPG